MFISFTWWTKRPSRLIYENNGVLITSFSVTTAIVSCWIDHVNHADIAGNIRLYWLSGRLTIFGSNYHSHRQTYKFKILRAHRERKSRYLNFKVFTGYLMCPKFKISAEFFFFFRYGWIELIELYKKNYVSGLQLEKKNNFSEKA